MMRRGQALTVRWVEVRRDELKTLRHLRMQCHHPLPIAHCLLPIARERRAEIKVDLVHRCHHPERRASRLLHAAYLTTPSTITIASCAEELRGLKYRPRANPRRKGKRVIPSEVLGLQTALQIDALSLPTHTPMHVRFVFFLISHGISRSHPSTPIQHPEKRREKWFYGAT